MGRVAWDWVGAAAGIALVVLLFLPWYELDARTSDRAVQGLLTTFAGGNTDATAWETLPRVSLLWIASAVLAVAAALVPWLGGGVLLTRWVTAATVAVGAAGFACAFLRLLDPPLESYSLAPPAYGAVAMSALVLTAGVFGLRRA